MNEKNNSKGREFLLSAKQQGTRPLLIGTHSKVAHRWHHWAPLIKIQYQSNSCHANYKQLLDKTYSKLAQN